MNFWILLLQYDFTLHPTRITAHSKTLIDIIFSNHISKEAICGNLTSTISDNINLVFDHSINFYRPFFIQIQCR